MNNDSDCNKLMTMICLVSQLNKQPLIPSSHLFNYFCFLYIS